MERQMKQTSAKSIARHLAAVNAGTVEKTNIIGIRKAINELERNARNPPEESDALFELECAIKEHRPRVTGALHDSGLKVLRNPRYAKRWNEREAGIISRLHHFELIRFDRVGPRGRYGQPVYRAVDVVGQSFAFRNIPWQTAYYGGLDDGPRIVPERGE
jgi:hypothetical protein